MNAAVGTLAGSDIVEFNGQTVFGPWLDGSGAHRPPHQPWRTYGKFGHITAPAPANLWIFLDEDYNSIDLGSFVVSMATNPTTMFDWPGTYHKYAGNFVFADGHGEMHRWKDQRTKKMTPSGTLFLNTPTRQSNNPDITWIQQRTSASSW